MGVQRDEPSLATMQRGLTPHAFVFILPFLGSFLSGCKIHPLSPGDSLVVLQVHLNKYVFTAGSFLKHALCS